MKDEDHPHGKAAALLAYALDIESAVDPAKLAQLVDEVCEDKTERARLISLLSTSQSPQLPKVVLELLGGRLDRLKDGLETVEDMDTVYGVWGQRVAGSAVLASVGFAATGIVTGGWALLAVGAAVLSAAGTSYGRDRLKRGARTSRRAVEQAERLIETIKLDLRKDG